MRAPVNPVNAWRAASTSFSDDGYSAIGSLVVSTSAHTRRCASTGAVLPPDGAGANVARLCANAGQCGATAVRRRSSRLRAVPGPVARCAFTKDWGDSGGCVREDLMDLLVGRNQ